MVVAMLASGAAVTSTLMQPPGTLGSLSKSSSRSLRLGAASQAGPLHVRAGKGRDGGKPRDVPLTIDARAAVRAWLPVRAELLERLAATGRPVTPDAERALWTSPRGTRMTARALRSVVNRIGAAAGVDVAPHVLRHSAATRWLRSGVDIEQVAELLGTPT
jgi:site-specific recombinase XerD